MPLAREAPILQAGFFGRDKQWLSLKGSCVWRTPESFPGGVSQGKNGEQQARDPGFAL